MCLAHNHLWRPSTPPIRPPETPQLLVDGYVQRSVRRGPQAPSGPATQEAVIRQWALRRGSRINRMVTESQLGGRRLEAALARIESQESDGLIVARLDYLGESLAHRLYAIERIQASCGRLVCAYNDFDFGTPAGQLVLRLILAAIDL